MAWIGKSHGIFRLHDSDRFCGSYISIGDAAEIRGVEPGALTGVTRKIDGNEIFLSELDIHRAWGAGRIPSPHPQKVGSATRSLDELILIRLIEITYPGAKIETQVPFGRKKVDLCLETGDKRLFIEFLGPSHFIRQYQRELRSPIERRKEIEDTFSTECVLWPYWIQRCSRNLRALIENEINGIASVWSTKAHFGDFQLPQSANVIVSISERFRAVSSDGIGYMYSDAHTTKPKHPILQRIIEGKESKDRLIPRDSIHEHSFWLPRELQSDVEQ